jgi:hypothetical protein
LAEPKQLANGFDQRTEITGSVCSGKTSRPTDS